MRRNWKPLDQADFAGLPKFYWEWWLRGREQEAVFPRSVIYDKMVEHTLQLPIREVTRQQALKRVVNGYCPLRLRRTLMHWNFVEGSFPLGSLNRASATLLVYDRLQPSLVNMPWIPGISNWATALEHLHYAVDLNMMDGAAPDEIVHFMRSINWDEDHLAYQGICARIARYAVERNRCRLERAAREESKRMKYLMGMALSLSQKDDIEVIL